MNPEMPRFDRPQSHEESSPENRVAPKPRPSQDTTLAPDPPPVSMLGHDESLPRRPRGFAGMDHELVREIARLGGKAAHSAGTAHEFTRDEARIAGRKGGLASRKNRRK
jgi:general stress protein YciG